MRKSTTRPHERTTSPSHERPHGAAPPKHPLTERQERYLTLLILLTRFLCLRRGCADRWCQRTGHCHDIERLARRFDVSDGIDARTAHNLLFALRAALKDTRFPGQDPNNRRPGEDNHAAVVRWHAELDEELRRLG